MGDSANGGDPYDDLEVPPEMRASLERHGVHLLELIRNLKVAGLTEAQVESSVAAFVASYREDLVIAIKAIVR